MTNFGDKNLRTADLVPVQYEHRATVLPPNEGILGRFLEETANMFKARAMRMTGLLRRINESGQHTEVLLRMAAEKMEAAQAAIEKDLRRQGLVPEADDNNDF